MFEEMCPVELVNGSGLLPFYSVTRFKQSVRSFAINEFGPRRLDLITMLMRSYKAFLNAYRNILALHANKNC